MLNNGPFFDVKKRSSFCLNALASFLAAAGREAYPVGEKALASATTEVESSLSPLASFKSASCLVSSVYTTRILPSSSVIVIELTVNPLPFGTEILRDKIFIFPFLKRKYLKWKSFCCCFLNIFLNILNLNFARGRPSSRRLFSIRISVIISIKILFKISGIRNKKRAVAIAVFPQPKD